MIDTFYVLECTAEQCVAEFYLNGIPIMRRGVEGGEFCGVQVNHLLVDGDNILELTAFPGPVPSLSRWGEFGPRQRRGSTAAEKIKMSLRKYPFGATVGGSEAEELARLEWQGSPDDVRERAFSLQTSADLGPMHGRWSWQDAPALTLDAAEQLELSELLDGLAAAIQVGDPGPFLAASETRIQETSRAYSTDPAERRAMINRGIFVDAGAPGFTVAPLMPSDFDFRLCAEGRMVELIAKDWQPILRAGPDRQGCYSYYDMFVSRIDGAWQIVR
jgi:hypothetical protein